MGIHVGLIPGVLLKVLDLGYVDEGGGAVGAGEILKGSGVAIVLAVESCFNVGEDGFQFDLGCSRRDAV